MKRKDFDDRIQMFKPGDSMVLHVRGMYGEYRVEGKLRKVDDRGFVYLDHGFAHSYRKITSMRRSALNVEL